VRQDRGVTVDQTVLDGVWDFGDPVGSEARIRQAIADEPNPAGQRELRTQLARAFGLQGRFSEGHAVLDALDLDDARVAVRVALERGRLHNSAEAPEEAARHFARAATLSADDPTMVFLHVDALHMLAIAEPERAEEWTQRAVEALATTDDPRTRRWLVALDNNLGWTRFDAGDLDGARTAFQASADAAERYGTEEQRRLAADAIAEVDAASGEIG
jgi:hypothetical protein